MERQAVIAVLQANADRLQRLGVRHAALFGSTARGEQRPDSDLDILIDVAPEAAIGVFEYVGIVQFLQSLFPVQVDVSNLAAQRSAVSASARRNAIYAF